MGSSMGAMIQAQQRQNQHTDTISAQAGRREFYRDWALAALMGYSQVYTESKIPRTWVKFQISNEYADNHQDIMVGIMYWEKKNGIEIDTAVLFVNL